MIYWLCLLFCSNLRSSFAYPPFYNMPEVNPLFLGPNVEENYEDYSDSRFDPQLNPWHLNSQQEMHPLRSDFVDSGMNYDEESTEVSATWALSQQHRNMKFDNKVKTKRPTKILKPYVNYQSNKQQEEDNDDYETDEDTALRRDIGNTLLPPNEMTISENSLELNKKPSDAYGNKRNDESLRSVFLPDNSPYYRNDVTNKFLEDKDRKILENNKRNSDSLRTADIAREAVAHSSLNGNEIEDFSNNRRSMQSLRNVYVTEEEISDAPEPINKMNNQNEDIEYKNDKRDDMTANDMQDDRLAMNSESESNNIDKDEHTASSGKKGNDNLMLRDTGSEDDKNFLPQSVTLVKSPRALNKTKGSQASPKLTFYNENQSSTDSEKNEFTSEKTYRLNTKRMTNDKLMSRRHQFLKHNNIKSGRESLHHFEQKLNMEDRDFNQGLNRKTLWQSLESGKNSESSKDIFNKRAGDKIPTDSEVKEMQQKKSVDPQKIDVSNNENVQTGSQHDFPKSNKDNSLKAIKSEESKRSKVLEDSDLNGHSDSIQVNLNYPNLSKKRSVEIIDVTTEKGSPINFKTNFKNQDDESQDLSKPRKTKTTSQTVIRSSNNFKLKKRINNYNRQTAPHHKHLPLATNAVGNRNALHHSNPYYPHNKHKYSKYNPYGRNQKRVPEYSPPSSLEVKELSGPHNYELNIAKHLNNRRGKIDEKLSRTMEDYKVKKTILKDAKTSKETDIVENENERIVDNVRVISDPNQTATTPPAPVNVPFMPQRPVYPFVNQGKVAEEKGSPVNVPFVPPGPVYPYIDQGKEAEEKESPVNVPFVPPGPVFPYVDQGKVTEDVYVDQDKAAEEEGSEEQVVESDTDNLNMAPDQQIVAPSAAEEEEIEQEKPQNEASKDYYEDESKEKVVSDNYYDIDEDQDDEAAQKILMPSSAENKVIPNQVDLSHGSETSLASQENYDEDYSEDSQKPTEIPLTEDVEPLKVLKEYIPPEKPPLKFSPEQIPIEKIYSASHPPPYIVFKNLKKNKPKLESMPHFGRKNKHKKIYQFSTEYAVSYGMDEFEKEEKLEKASKTVVRNKLMTANESSHHFQEKKTEIKNNKESYHEAFIEEKDENKFPREMDSNGNIQRSAPASPYSQDQSNSNPHIDPDYPRNSADDTDSELVGDQEYQDEPGRAYSGRISERFSPSDELTQHETLIDNVKRSQPSLKISRDANTNSFANKTQALENLHDGRRDASSVNRESYQKIQQKNSKSNLEGLSNGNKEVRESNGSGTPSWTVPYSESKSGNVVYITLRTTTMDLEKKYNDFIQIQDGERSPGRFERHPKHYMRKRRKNRNTERKTFGQ